MIPFSLSLSLFLFTSDHRQVFEEVAVVMSMQLS